MKIAIASSGLGHVARGVETWAMDTAAALAERGLDVTLFAGGDVKCSVFNVQSGPVSKLRFFMATEPCCPAHSAGRTLRQSRSAATRGTTVQRQEGSEFEHRTSNNRPPTTANGQCTHSPRIIVLPCLHRFEARTTRLARVTPGAGWRWGLKSGYGWEQFTFWWRLWPRLRRGRFDILHVQDPMLAFWCRKFRRLGLMKTREILAHGTEEPVQWLAQFDYVQHLAPWHLANAERGTRKVEPSRGQESVGPPSKLTFFMDTEPCCPAHSAGRTMRQSRSAAMRGTMVQKQGVRGQAGPVSKLRFFKDLKPLSRALSVPPKADPPLEETLSTELATKLPTKAPLRGVLRDKSGDGPPSERVSELSWSRNASCWKPASGRSGLHVARACRTRASDETRPETRGREPVTQGHPYWVAIPNFVDTEVFRPARDAGEKSECRKALGLPPDAFLIGTAATVKKPHKRIDYLIREFARFQNGSAHPSSCRQSGLAQESPSSTNPRLPHLLIAGAKTPQSNELAALANELAPGRITFCFDLPRDAMPAFYRALDVFVLASVFEMVPIAVLEALASGVPMALHHIPQLEWMMNGGGMAIDMASEGALSRFLADLTPEWIEEHGHAARQHALTAFSKEVVIGQYIDYYRRILAPHE